MENIIKQLINEFERDWLCEDWLSEDYVTENWRIFGDEQEFKAICARAGINPRRTRGAVQYAKGDRFTLRHYDDGDRIVLSVFCA